MAHVDSSLVTLALRYEICMNSASLWLLQLNGHLILSCIINREFLLHLDWDLFRVFREYFTAVYGSLFYTIKLFLVVDNYVYNLDQV